MRYPDSIDSAAPVVARAETVIHAPVEEVWRLLTDVSHWPRWQPDIPQARITGSVAPGVAFRWSTAGLDIESTVYEMAEPYRLLWGGPAQGITGIHGWTFQHRAGGGLLARTEESWDGELVRADARRCHAVLEQSLTQWLGHLKRAAEDA